MQKVHRFTLVIIDFYSLEVLLLVGVKSTFFLGDVSIGARRM